MIELNVNCIPGFLCLFSVVCKRSSFNLKENKKNANILAQGIDKKKNYANILAC